MVRFSVIIPVYKVEKYIAKCIKSLLKQTFDDFECIFVDDCGGDSSIDIIKRYAENNSQLKIVYQPENLGVGAARNRGIDESCGEYITFVDPDDWVEPDYLEVLNKTFEQNNANWAIFKYTDENDIESKAVRFSIPPKYFSHKDGIEKITPSTINDYTAFCWTKAYKADWLKNRSIRYPHTTYEETLFYFHCIMDSPEICVVDKKIYHYLMRESSWTTSNDINLIRKNIQSLEYLKDYIPKLIEKEGYDKDYIPEVMRFIERFYNYQLSLEQKCE